jgi:hypothetical protein
VFRWIYDSEPKPLCNVPEAFFRAYVVILSPFQDRETRASPWRISVFMGHKMEIICMQVMVGQEVEQVRFNTDSGTCGINNRASTSMSLYKADFMGPLVEEKWIIHGFENAKVYTIYQGTLLLTIQGDDYTG